MPYRSTWRYRLHAAHKLSGLPASHPEGRSHGHTYVVEVSVQAAALQPQGWVVDPAKLAAFEDWLRSSVDHRDLNAVFSAISGKTTPENVAAQLQKKLVSMGVVGASVAVSDSDYWGQFDP